MSITATFSFTEPLDYTYPDTIEVTNGVAQLVLSDSIGQIFIEDFVDDTSFTYDSNYSEFSMGQVQQISYLPTDAVCYATYTTDVNLNYGIVLTGTPIGGASISGNKLDLNYSDLRHVIYNASGNADMANEGCIKFRITPNYIGNPSEQMTFFTICKAVSDETNLIQLRHWTNGNLQLLINSFTDSIIVKNNSVGGLESDSFYHL